MVSSSQIKQHVAQYLANQTNLADFENWFVPNTRDIRKTRSEAALAVTFSIEGILSDYLSKVLDERELRNELSQILDADNKIVEIIDAPITVYSFRSSAPSQLVPVNG